jgi:rfaE bifunctional protein kinase chain/domain
MLTDESLERILSAIPRLTVGVLGDLFLDRYLDIDGALDETSLETGLRAYQVVRVRSLPGAAGTVINNLATLGVGRVCPISLIGDDGEGHELRQALRRLGVVEEQGILTAQERRTPTYTKPMLAEPGLAPRELNRLDIKNRTPTQDALQDRIRDALDRAWPCLDVLLVLDQVSEDECGVVTARIRELLAELGGGEPARPILADSRERIGQFHNVWLKPNQQECRRAAGNKAGELGPCVAELARRAGRPVYCTRGAEGILLAKPQAAEVQLSAVLGYPVSGPIDVVGAGDSTSAAIACAVAGGATPEEAAAFGNLVASITIQQIGTTGTATPKQVRQRWAEVLGGR